MKRVVSFGIPIVLMVFGVMCGERCLAEDPAIGLLPEASELTVELPNVPESRVEGAAVIGAVNQYLQKIEEIETTAARQKAEARARLLAALEARAHGPAQDVFPGLVGGSTVNGDAGRYVFEYAHGAMFDRQIVWDRFHDGETAPFPSVAITLQGYVVAPRKMTVFVRHAGGGVNEDWAELFINDRSIGVVGDDTVKKSVYVIELPEGTHRVRWILTAGTFQHCLLKFEDPQSGEPLQMYHTLADRAACGYTQAREVVPVNADLAAWPLIDAPHEWNWTPFEVCN